MLGLLSVATHNLPELQAFYRQLLDAEPAVVLEGTYAEFRLAGLRLGLYRSSNPEFEPCLGATSICLQVSDLDVVLERPVLQAVELSPLRSEFHGREVDCCDPDGNRIVIHEPSEEFWGLMDFDRKPVKSRLD